ncbi:MAG TPA: methylated-DNA--[protein]-cysteine S-methyltransferase [Vicinamibacterales bacterium]|nr:methylated-DNA--[protein]-cysteine S-methyltransferase [Vicinamibacterales bacterium]
MIEIAVVHTPVDALTLAARGGRLCALHFGDREAPVRQALHRWYPGEAVEHRRDPAGAATALAKYFSGRLDAFDGIEVELNGTAFQQRVWTALRSIRPGRTASYADIAGLIGAPSAVRAVGAANGANPIAVVVPCHRVIGSNGTLTGYGGGLRRKEWLLRHEGCRLF